MKLNPGSLVTLPIIHASLSFEMPLYRLDPKTDSSFATKMDVSKFSDCMFPLFYSEVKINVFFSAFLAKV